MTRPVYVSVCISVCWVVVFSYPRDFSLQVLQYIRVVKYHTVGTEQALQSNRWKLDKCLLRPEHFARGICILTLPLPPPAIFLRR